MGKTIQNLENKIVTKAKDGRLFPYLFGSLIPLSVTLVLLATNSQCRFVSSSSMFCESSPRRILAVAWGLYFLCAFLFFILDTYFDKRGIYENRAFLQNMVFIMAGILVYGVAALVGYATFLQG
jgi:hypothetical protein